MGRWLTPDPLGYTDGPNIYAYCGNDPVNYVDPMGLFSTKEAVLFGLGWSRAGRDSLLPYIFGNNPYLNSLIDPLQNKIIGAVLGVDESAFTTEAGSLKEAIPVYGFKLQCEKMGTACGTGSAYSKGYQSFMTIQSFGGNALALYGLSKLAVGGVQKFSNVTQLNKVEGLSDKIVRLSESHITGKGKTVLGHWEDITGKGNYIDKAIARKANFFDLGDVYNTLSPAQKEAANFHFLDIIAEQGDDVLLSVPKHQILPGSSLTKEIQYLIKNKGYKWINQWCLRKRQ